MSPRSVSDEADERTSLVHNASEHNVREYGARNRSASNEDFVDRDAKPVPTDDKIDKKPLWRKNGILLLAAFLVNADTSMVYGIFRQIASEYNQLSAASWIITGNIIGTIVSQPLYGKLSDIYGRKAMVIFSLSCACLGGIIAGSGFSFWGVIAGRVISGIANAGVSVLVSTIIVDNVPFSKIAMWRSIVYASNQMGRALGLPLGGAITDATNWRWAILYQVPLFVIIISFIWWKMEFYHPQPEEGEHETCDRSQMAKFKRIDFSGAISLGIANLSLLLCLDQAPRNLDLLRNLLAIIPLGTWAVFLVTFILVELYWSPEPILPIRLLAKRNILSAYAIQFFHGAIQTGFLSALPLYFRVTQSASNTKVSLHVLVLSVGSMIGTIFSGIFITRTGRYRRLIQMMQLVSIATSTLIFFRWRGSTSWFETLYALPSGMSFSVALSATFIALNDGLPAARTAVATSGFYLCLNIGSNFGVGVSGLIIQAILQHRLTERLSGTPGWRKMIHDITSDINNLEKLPPAIRHIAVDAYNNALHYVWFSFIILAICAFLSSLILRKERLHNSPGKSLDQRNISEED